MALIPACYRPSGGLTPAALTVVTRPDSPARTRIRENLMSILGKNHFSTAGVAAVFVLVLAASGCGAPARVLDPGPPEPSRTGAPFHTSPDHVDRPARPGEAPSEGAAPCVFSADAAERLGRSPCLS